MKNLCLFALVGTLTLLAGCQRQPAGVPLGDGLRSFDARGVIREIAADGRKAVIRHEEIPGYMEAMTMQLEVKDTNELVNLRPGDQINFRLLVTDTDAWIDHVQKTGAGVEVAAVATPAAPSLKELNPGDPLLDCILTNQLGRTIQLSDFKGGALAFTFIFTRCPLPTYCPRMNHHFAAVQTALLAGQAGTNWQLLSISFDPEFDTPARLLNYAADHNYDLDHWSFATGTEANIRQLGGAFGLAYWRLGGTFNHNVRTVVVDAAGRVQKIFPNNEWQPAELVEEMKKAMAAKN